MTSIIKVQNIQYTDGDAALTIADGGIVTGHNTLNVSHGTTGNSVGTFINTTGNSNTNGVVHVKQSAGTNQPTMVIEQTGTGGNPSDTQGLHIKIAGQNQGSGHALRVTTTNANLNSGNAYDPFMVSNGGNLEIKNTSNASTLSLNTSGQLTMPLQPAFRGENFTAGVATNGTTGGPSNQSHYKCATIKLNVGNHFDNTNGIFTCPTAGVYYAHHQWTRNSDNWVGCSIMHNTTMIRFNWMEANSRDLSGYDTREISALISAAANDKIYFTYNNDYTAPSNAGNNSDMNIWKVS